MEARGASQRDDSFSVRTIASSRKELLSLCTEVGGHGDYGIVGQAFELVVDLFEGRVDGYGACNTRYHDLYHTLGVAQATARLVHAAHVSTGYFDAEDMSLSVVAALFHDTGFLPSERDSAGTGAKYTSGHEARSITVLQSALWPLGVQHGFLDGCAQIVRCTALDTDPADVVFDRRETQLLGKIVAAADLLAQVADPVYLERLPFLYDEMVEAQLTDAPSVQDFFERTQGFFAETYLPRMSRQLGWVANIMRNHFRVRYGLNHDPYHNYAYKNMRYLGRVVSRSREGYQAHLRRAAPAAA